jgi:hypothetical protein
MSNVRQDTSLPSYDSVIPSYVSTYEAYPNVNPSEVEQHENPDQSRKSYIISTLQALDGHAEIKGWPVEPRKLRDRTTLSILFGISEVLITLAPVAFISKTQIHEITGTANES